MPPSLPYHEPGIEDILILSTFLLALNAINSLLDRTLYCGLVGQVLVGIAWGTPGGKWLSQDVEHAAVQLGYLGLILMVFEGGLSATISGLTANLALSAGVALTGVGAPMGLSFALGPLAGASALQCFAAGAALCATSLGTTFAVLGTSGLVRTRLGSILSTAAMLDDVVGLVMVQVVAGLGRPPAAGGGFVPALVVRPVLVSLAFAAALPLACRFALRPLLARLWRLRAGRLRAAFFRLTDGAQAAFAIHTAVLLGLVVGAAYAGASVLLAAYLAGIAGSWWRDERARLERSVQKQPARRAETGPDPASTSMRASGGADRPADPVGQPEPGASPDGSVDVYEKYYQQAVERVLKPFFFASVGFSIPISQMFAGPVVWRGIVYTVLMMLGKAVCGAWLVRVPAARRIGTGASTAFASAVRSLTRGVRPGRLVHKSKTVSVKGAPTSPTEGSSSRQKQQGTVPQSSARVPEKQQESPAPLSLYPAGIISCAMTARGEIGFLISSVAETKGVFRQGSDAPGDVSEIFLIVTWAIVLCTILGPLCVGLLVRRVKRLEAQSSAAQVEGHKRNALGVWGVS